MVGQPRRILCIEDDPVIRDLLREVLVAEGYAVVTFETADDALAHVRGIEPDLILVDLKLPGLDGSEFIQRYRGLRMTPRPIIVITAARVIQDVPTDVQCVITKPFDIDTLTSAIEEILTFSETPTHRQLTGI